MKNIFTKFQKAIDDKIRNSPWFLTVTKLIYKKKNWLKQIEISER